MRLTTWWRLLIASLLISVFVLEAPPVTANDAVLRWKRLPVPEDGAAGNWAIANNGGAGTGVSRIAVASDGKTIYALDSTTPLLLKSDDGGYAWNAITGRVPGFTTLNHIAVAPDDAGFVVVVDAGRPEVFLSRDGGISFAPTGVAGAGITGTIRDVVVSGSFSAGGGSSRGIVFGTSSGTAAGQVWMMTIGAQFQPWVNVTGGAAGWTPADVFAVAFSPGYVFDRTVLAVAADNAPVPGDSGNAGTTWLRPGRIDLATRQIAWNAFPGYPVAVTAPGRDSPGTPLVYASLALPTDYSSADRRGAFVSWSDGVGGNTGDDVYRVDDSMATRLNAGGGPEFVAASIAYHGTRDRGRLLAGRHAGGGTPPAAPSVQVRLTLDPQSASPTWRDSLKPPTGTGEARIAWSADGNVAFCGTSGAAPNDESAFSRSSDAGLSWNQTGLIDTRISSINNIQAAPDGSALFVTTVNTGAASADSLWRSTSSPPGQKWERVLARSSAGTGDNPLVRIDPDYRSSQTLWFVNAGPALASQELLVSLDGGNTYSSSYPNIVLVDLAAEDRETVYGVDAAGLVSKGTRGGKVWASPVNTYLGDGYSIACARATTTPDNDKGHVIVGGRGTGNTDVAYSTNGGATFTPVGTPLPTRGSTLVVASSGYKSDGSILAVNAGGMYAWSIFTGKKEWEEWWGGASFPSAVTGLQISRGYGFYFATPASAWSPATPYTRWSAANAGLDPNMSLGTQPSRRLALSGGMVAGEPVTLWVVDQRPYATPQGGIWYYTDTLSWLGPTPVAPVSGAQVDHDPVTGRAAGVNLRWESSSLSAGYQVQIALDDELSSIIADIGGGWAGPFYYPASPDSPVMPIPAGGGAVRDSRGNTWTLPGLLPGKTYYWRVRVQNVTSGDSIKSPWSWVESFRVRIGVPVRAPY